MKHCPDCDQVLPITKFHKDRRSKDGKLRICAKCAYRHYKRWYVKNQPTVKATYDRRKLSIINSRMKQNYGIGIAEYVEMYQEQEGLCVCCWQPARDDKDFPLVIDHDHKTGAVRALICSPCNLAIGHIKENVQRALDMAEYLRRFQCQQAS